MLVDTHCHINFDAYDADRAEVLGRAADADVELIIIPSVDLATIPAILNFSLNSTIISTRRWAFIPTVPSILLTR